MSGSPKSPTLLTILARSHFKQMHKWLGLVLTAQHSDSQRHMGTMQQQNSSCLQAVLLMLQTRMAAQPSTRQQSVVTQQR
jgi:hypothetical protein